MDGRTETSTPPLPLVGRGQEINTLREILCRSEEGPNLVFLTGGQGVGKSRLATTAAEEALANGNYVVHAQAFPLDNNAPFSLFSDAFTPIIHGMESTSIQAMSRGGLAELGRLFPAALNEETSWTGTGGNSEERRTRMFWAFAEFLRNMASKNPLVLILEDLHWADPSSLELLHFISRQVQASPITFIATYTDLERDGNPVLGRIEKSLADLGLSQRIPLGSLTHTQTANLLERALKETPESISGFAGLLFGWTRGNPFFINATLQDLRETGTLYQKNGSWIGWNIKELRLPSSIREATLTRFDRLSDQARTVAETLCVMGRTARLEVLEELEEVSPEDLIPALEELRKKGLVKELSTNDGITYEFTHPILNITLKSTLGLARQRDLHGRCGVALEDRFGASALDHAEELARHFSQADLRTLGEKAVQYLAAAGETALQRHANQTAAQYLRAASRVLERVRTESVETRVRILFALARAQHRLGDSQESVELLYDALDLAKGSCPLTLVASIRRRLGLIHYLEGRHPEGLDQFEIGLAECVGDEMAEARAELLLAKGGCLLEVGRSERAEAVFQDAEAIATQLGNVKLLARVTRAFVILYAWTGPAELAQEGIERALELAKRTGDQNVAFWAYWARALTASRSGRLSEVETSLDNARTLADELGAPVLKLWLSELAVETFYSTGRWDKGLAEAEQAISVARALNQSSLTVRHLVLACIIQLERGEKEQAIAYAEEAWSLSNADRLDSDSLDLFSIVPAHVARATCALWDGDYELALAIGEAGIELAEGSGYQAWILHRLLPIVGEAHIMLRNLEAAAQVGIRIRAIAERLDHRLGLAWADTLEALIIWLKGDSEQGAIRLEAAATMLEEIPMIPYAARIRRQLAGRLAETGHRGAALAELRKVHSIFSELGAAGELTKTREMFREIEARPPKRTFAPGVDGLTGRELEIGRLVGERKSNKAIGKALDISDRTVSTHLSNIFKKLRVSSRGELADLMREGAL